MFCHDRGTGCVAGHTPAEDTYSQPHADKDRDGDAAFAAAEQLSDSG